MRRRRVIGARASAVPVPPEGATAAPRPRVSRGFSTVEILTALVVGMIVSVIGFSSFRIFNHRLPPKSAGTRFSHALSTARAFAVSHNGYYRVVLDLENANFWIDEIPNPNLPPSDPSAGPYNPKIVSPEAVDQRVKIEGVLVAGSPIIQSAGLQTWIFRPDGSVDRDSHIFFYAAQDNPADNSNIFTVRLYGPTGHNKLFSRQRV